MRNLGITVLSLLLTTLVIGNAYFQKKQFYPSVVYITKSNPSMAVIYIQAFILVILTGKLMRKVFFGELRAVELEHLMERSWYAVTETCLAFTVFRDDFSPKFVALFTLLLFLKSFHWLADERVDFMERSPVISWLFHVRIISLLFMLGILDTTFVIHAYQSTLNKGASVQLVFGFEYAILLTIILNILIKYAFHVNDFHELPWENKAVFLLYTELVMGFIKVILYFSFVFIMVRIYTLPLFAFRPMYYTVRAFKKAINDVIMSRRAIRNMNTLYPDATPEELAAADNVCIICREEMHSASKKLPCNHIFHTSCLRSWFQRQQTCPTCRLNILRAPGNNQSPTQPPPPRARPEQQQPPPPRPDFQWGVPPPPPMANIDNDPTTAGDRNHPAAGSSTMPPSCHPPPPPGAESLAPFFCPPFHIAAMPFISLYHKIKSNGLLKKTATCIKSYGGYKTKPIGEVELICSYKDITKKLNFIVVDLNSSPILGADSCLQFNLLKRLYNVSSQSNDPANESPSFVLREDFLKF
ncbi:Ring finger protein [Nesidiocoris tenuis]|uniref:RING-type E3 ubiquitin transferase n=1 Tax=Nesidiocoris tenuis TaxID=355587 RepID=A0ABN7ADN4_9HEMI|nr:Ring finger protein [Nesidiocoris tenuis]